ncbi:MAG: HD domain-containing phosphohydrolase [Planctomycetota bacterium]
MISAPSKPQSVPSLGNRDLDLEGRRILIVDDDPLVVRMIQHHLAKAGFRDFVTCHRSLSAMDLVRSNEPDLAIIDVMMPGMSGLDLLEEIRADNNFYHLPILIITSSNQESIKLDALEQGATDFIQKPLKAVELLPRVRNALMIKQQHDEVTAYSKLLEKEVAARTAALAQAREEVIHVLACASEYRDHETGNHVIRVGRFAGLIARELGFDAERVELIEQAAILHDAGKIGIADSVLLKPGKLTEQEFALMKQHCEFGERILRAEPNEHCKTTLQSPKSQHPRSPILQLAAVVAMTHHERWDGTGYPKGLAGEDIPIEGRITAVADVFDALSSSRCYKEPFPMDKCLDIMINEREKHFDPEVLDAFLRRIEEAKEIVVTLSDECLPFQL